MATLCNCYTIDFIMLKTYFIFSISKSNKLFLVCFHYTVDVGARYFERCAVDKILTKNGRVNAVVTSLGTIKCEYFVNCAGMVRTCFVIGYFDVCNNN